MLITEVINPLKTFLAQIRAGGMTVRTTVDADSMSQARAILQHLYGVANIYSVTQLQTLTNEAGTIKPQSPAELRVKALADQAANLKQQAKRMKAQQGLAKAQERLRKSNVPAKPF